MSLGGRAVAIWVENFPPKIEANIFNGTNWQQPVVISLGAFPQVGIDNVGNAIAIWVNTSNNQIFTSRYSVASNTWSAPLLLSIAGGVNAAPKSVSTRGECVGCLGIDLNSTDCRLLLQHNNAFLVFTCRFS